MKSPAEMRIILIDITNACVRQCSNCTRFCGHHQKPFFMDYETFCRAVDSMEGFPGTVGIIGGEPTLHPDFERMARYIGEKRGPKTDFSLYRPQKNFMDAVHDVEMSHTYIQENGCEEKRLVYGGGVWSVMGDGYKKHYEVIQDIAKYQALNDHLNPMYHKPALISRKELGITDEEWIPMRDNCWVVDVWSANITPKGAFFCEVAGCLDMLFDGPGGWPIEPGWWRRRPEEFGDQLKWCEICGMACETFTRDANEGIDDVSPMLYEKLKAIGSRKVKNGTVNVVEINDGIISEKSKAKGKVFNSDMPYVEHYSDRFDAKKTSLYYKEYIGIHICNSVDELDACLKSADKCKEIYILGPKEVLSCIDKINYTYKLHTFDISETNLGYVIWKALKDKDHNTYAICTFGKIKIIQLLNRLDELVLNPGTLLYNEIKDEIHNDYYDATGSSVIMLMNGMAHSIKAIGWDNLLKIQSFQEIAKLWHKEKVFELIPETEGIVPINRIIPKKTYAVYGAGRKIKDTLDYIRDGGGTVSLIVDPAEILRDRLICGYCVHEPDYLKNHRDEFDIVMIMVGPYYKQAKDYLLSIGISAGDMAWV